MAVTIDDIAREAGVSVSTVSRVINNSKPVSDALREKVFDIIERNNYKPNALAQGLATNRTNMIGVVVPDISNAVFGMLTKGINSICARRGYTIIVCESGGKLEEELRLLQVLQDKIISGVLFAGVDVNKTLTDAMLDKDYPVVLVTQEASAGEGIIHTVIHDNVRAVHDATNFLLENGHRKIAYVGGEKHDFSSGKKRLAGYKSALQDAGIPITDSWITQKSFSYQSGYDAMRKIYEENVMLPTAVVAGSDLIAAGVIQFLKDVSVSVPEEISVIGFDDLESITYLPMNLSTVRINYFDEGEKAARALMRLIDGVGEMPKTEYVPHKIIRRSTTKAVR